MSYFICPICGADFEKTGSSLVCSNRHVFDIAREGYVNLLPSGKASSSVPGDNKQMVDARTMFLNSGGYEVFAKAIAVTAAKHSKPQSVIMDAGCGQGYYDRFVKDALPGSRLFGLDLSKCAVKYAASHGKDMEYAVAGVYDMPAKSGAFDLILSIFSPIAETEFARIASPGAILIIAVPGPDHLFGLKKILYDMPYKNEVCDTVYQGFEFVERVVANSSLTIENPLLKEALFAMTPYYWKTGPEGHRRLENSPILTTQTEFHLLVYKKI